ncbi:hypothetical protein [Rhodococcoides fascians]|uniref:hypothetical protein n=1 Tax=Rhodococcoides fascians TaxID=1828 RepID=UPI00050CFFE3|nr:hypothetical protein [Rhodococcus fascians]
MSDAVDRRQRDRGTADRRSAVVGTAANSTTIPHRWTHRGAAVTTDRCHAKRADDDVPETIEEVRDRAPSPPGTEPITGSLRQTR